MGKVTSAYLVFHLNLAFSSIEVRQREDVVARCYEPLLDLAERRALPVGIELTGWTLQQIAVLRPSWVYRFRSLLQQGKCELIGSGHVQLIGPLVPWAVNRWNQTLGLADYQELLGVRPALALVNEMAFSSGLVQVYREAEYEGIIMDRDNVRLALDLSHQPYETIPTHAQGPDGLELPVLWSDSILFQKLQRWAHGDIPWEDYLTYFRKRARGATRPLAVYCNDAEIFDFRPGRFLEESALVRRESEWGRIEALLTRLHEEEGVQWLAPRAALAASLENNSYHPSSLTSISQPIPVKKQAKYNIARWAVSGRNDIWINTACHRLLAQAGEGSAESVKRRICEFWASDLRTHITAERWQQVRAELQHLLPSGAAASEGGGADPPMLRHPQVTESSDGLFITVRTDDLHLVLNRRRGLTIQSLAFRSHDFCPVIGTLSHGYFDAINFGADFYSGGVVVELPGEHRRVTDLVPVAVVTRQVGTQVTLAVGIDTPLGRIEKTVSFGETGEQVSLSYSFPGWGRPKGIVRVGSTTLLPEAFQEPLSLKCCNGGLMEESFLLDRECDHPRASSSLVSCTTGLGATEGRIWLGDRGKGLLLGWDPAESAALPMLIHHPVPPSHLTRLVFSLSELDDTSRPEGEVLGFSYWLSPA